MTSIAEVKEQLYNEIAELIKNSTFISEVGSADALARCEKMAKNLIANIEKVEPDQIQLFHLRWEDNTIIFNGYRINAKN